MKKSVFLMVTLTLAGFAQIAVGVDYDINDLQYQSDPEDFNSPHVGEDVNCIGGIVIHKYLGKDPKVTLYDPNYPDGWGGIVVKDFTENRDFYYANDVNVGVWVSLTHTTVEEFRGNTQLKFESKSGFNPESTGNALPEPIIVSPSDIARPVDLRPIGWLVENHNAEKYEAMLVRVDNVIVTEKGLGKAGDNYSLESYYNAGPNDICWAADYMNEDEFEDYHPFVEEGQHFCSVTGIIEQYDGYKNSYEWDYYQLLTTKTDDFLVIQPADFDNDCDVDFLDYSHFAQYWLVDCYSDPNLCGGTDLVENNFVDMNDLVKFISHWLEGVN